MCLSCPLDIRKYSLLLIFSIVIPDSYQNHLLLHIASSMLAIIQLYTDCRIHDQLNGHHVLLRWWQREALGDALTFNTASLMIVVFLSIPISSPLGKVFISFCLHSMMVFQQKPSSIRVGSVGQGRGRGEHRAEQLRGCMCTCCCWPQPSEPHRPDKVSIPGSTRHTSSFSSCRPACTSFPHHRDFFVFIF